MHKNKYKYSFSQITFYNRWKNKYSKPCSWTIFGIEEWWAGPNKFRYSLCIFGFQMNIWINRKWQGLEVH